MIEPLILTELVKSEIRALKTEAVRSSLLNDDKESGKVSASPGKGKSLLEIWEAVNGRRLPIGAVSYYAPQFAIGLLHGRWQTGAEAGAHAGQAGWEVAIAFRKRGQSPEWIAEAMDTILKATGLPLPAQSIRPLHDPDKWIFMLWIRD